MINSSFVNTNYFLETLQFLNEVQWLYNNPLTEILICGALDDFPEGWLDIFENMDNKSLNHFVSKKIAKHDWPKSLEEFARKCREIDKLSTSYPLIETEIPNNFTIRLNPKKKHEIMHLAHLINEQCKNDKIDLIIDFGAGLGYICQLLYHMYGYRVLGLEANKQNVENAKIRQTKYYPESLHSVKYAHCKLTSDSLPIINSILQTEFPTAVNICLIGLHACGDLSIYASEVFSKMNTANLLILISCCYHKLLTVKSDSSKKQYFQNFPISSTMRDAIDKSNLDTGSFLRIPFLRLACQEPVDRWENMSEESHFKHSFYVLARAILQLYAKQGEFILNKNVRKGTRKSQCLNIESYIRDSLLRYTFQHVDENMSNMDNETRINQILQLWEEHKSKLKTAEFYTGLQLMLQGVAESLVLNDRLCWLNEQNLEAKIIPVMNKSLSPRSHALVSKKKI